MTSSLTRPARRALEIPDFSEKTVDAITPLLPDFANVRNPLDVTGFAMANRSGAGR